MEMPLPFSSYFCPPEEKKRRMPCCTFQGGLWREGKCFHRLYLRLSCGRGPQGQGRVWFGWENHAVTLPCMTTRAYWHRGNKDGVTTVHSRGGDVVMWGRFRASIPLPFSFTFILVIFTVCLTLSLPDSILYWLKQLAPPLSVQLWCSLPGLFICIHTDTISNCHL